ncbi:MAG TPA: hypothetical protein VJZ27_04270 [Aggregatilineales bacterium]|nr:hypothetical protein [Aggregatilineales bacterium]
MIDKRIQLILILLFSAFLLGACDQIDELTENADVSRIEEA